MVISRVRSLKRMMKFSVLANTFHPIPGKAKKESRERRLLCYALKLPVGRNENTKSALHKEILRPREQLFCS
jgi:hypothetical protein